MGLDEDVRGARAPLGRHRAYGGRPRGRRPVGRMACDRGSPLKIAEAGRNRTTPYSPFHHRWWIPFMGAYVARMEGYDLTTGSRANHW